MDELLKAYNAAVKAIAEATKDRKAFDAMTEGLKGITLESEKASEEAARKFLEAIQNSAK